jgi:hypothetical protein
MVQYSIHQVQVLAKKDLMNKRTLDILFYISIIVLCISLTSCASKNTKMETHPTNNKNTLEALDKFWELLKPLRVLNGVSTVN